LYIIEMSKKSINNSMDIPKLCYDSVNRRSNIYDVERSLDSYVQQNYVTLYDCISTKNLAAIKLPNQKLLSLAAPAPAPADAGAAPVGVNRVPNVYTAAHHPDFATLVTTAQTTAAAAPANPDDAVIVAAALAASGALSQAILEKANHPDEPVSDAETEEEDPPASQHRPNNTVPYSSRMMKTRKRTTPSPTSLAMLFCENLTLIMPTMSRENNYEEMNSHDSSD
jgi:hypothetical protein